MWFVYDTYVVPTIHTNPCVIIFRVILFIFGQLSLLLNKHVVQFKTNTCRFT